MIGPGEGSSGGEEIVVGPGTSNGAPEPDDAVGREFASLLARRDVHMVFQPLVELYSGEVVALEALARGPASSPLASPLALFGAAHRAGHVAELDWVCRAAAFRSFLAAGVPPAMSLFVNVEAEALAEECPADLAADVAKAESVLRVFVEVNDRALAADPAGVLAVVDRARARGWGIALDDVGVSRAPVAMLPIVNADLVKLDRRVLRAEGPENSSSVIVSALRHAELAGASLLVEGIASEEDADWARDLGAKYGQGYHLGYPGPLGERYSAPRAPVPLIKTADQNLEIDSPFDLFKRAHRRMGKEALEDLFRLVAHSPAANGTWPIILACVGNDPAFGWTAIEHVLGRGSSTLLSVVFGTLQSPEPATGVRGIRLRPVDPLAEERLLVILSDQAPIALCARRSRDGKYDVAITQSPVLVHGIAHHLIRRVPRLHHGSRALMAPKHHLDEGPGSRTMPAAVATPAAKARRGGFLSRHRNPS
ncbi:MAG: EAL domain-containing protein [Cellulomonas sp.]